MEVILREAVEKLGHPGDVVKVSPGFARNYLLPRGIAYEATPGNLKRIAQEKERLEAAENLRRAAAQEVATKLDLAKAYHEMGDREGARELLSEVLKEGDGAQQQQAKKMLETIG